MRNATEMTNAVRVASHVSVRFWRGSIPSVNARKSGMTPKTSMATKRGMNARRNVSTLHKEEVNDKADNERKA
jgi:hypothetical protein